MPTPMPTPMPIPMQTIQLGHQGPTIPALGIGTWAWGDNLFWSYGKDYGESR